MSDPKATATAWPQLEWHQWEATAETLHMLTQIVGKTRLALTLKRNHWWNVPLYVTTRGLSTSAMPLPDGDILEIEFNFFSHVLTFSRNSGATRALPLQSQPVAEFYSAYRRTLKDLGVEVNINTKPVECLNPIRFDQDVTHRSYDADAARRFWQALILADTLFKRFSGNFYGKISPVHFFWGSFDLAVTRFNGKRAPPRAGADAIQAEAYSHECISAGFWPGNGGYGQAAFYCYAAPVPAGLADVPLGGRGRFNASLGEFLLNYDEIRELDDPSKSVLDFLERTYSVCADAAHWDRDSLDRQDVSL
jgi:Family of unknown function (DUF5996)